MIPDRQKVRTDGRKDGRNGRADGQTDGRMDDAKTISLRLRRGIIRDNIFTIRINYRKIACVPLN